MPNRREFLASAVTSATAISVANATESKSISKHVEIEKGDLQATIGDNSATPNHRSGYNGIWHLSHRLHPRSIFVPGIAGLNLEHAITGVPLKSDDEFFEPRRSPMQLTLLQPNEVELYQSATPCTHVESWTKYRFASEHCIDMDFRCRLHQNVFPFGYLALFWASYINAPFDKSMYFLGNVDGKTEQWLQLCTQVHNDQSTVRYQDDKFEMKFMDDGRPALFKSLSPLRYTKPLFYGNVDDLMWCVMFEHHAGIRFTHSPSGGGFDQERRTSNPAWDFQFVIENPALQHDYQFKARTLLVPRCSRDELLSHYTNWQSHLKNTAER